MKFSLTIPIQNVRQSRRTVTTPSLEKNHFILQRKIQGITNYTYIICKLTLQNEKIRSSRKICDDGIMKENKKSE